MGPCSLKADWMSQRDTFGPWEYVVQHDDQLFSLRLRRRKSTGKGGSKSSSEVLWQQGSYSSFAAEGWFYILLSFVF